MLMSYSYAHMPGFNEILYVYKESHTFPFMLMRWTYLYKASVYDYKKYKLAC